MKDFVQNNFHVLCLFALVLAIGAIATRHETQFWESAFTSAMSALFLAISPRGSDPKAQTEEKKP